MSVYIHGVIIQEKIQDENTSCTFFIDCSEAVFFDNEYGIMFKRAM